MSSLCPHVSISGETEFWPQNPTKCCFSSANHPRVIHGWPVDDSRKSFVIMMGLPTFFWIVEIVSEKIITWMINSNNSAILSSALVFVQTIIPQFVLIYHKRNTKCLATLATNSSANHSRKQNLLRFWGLFKSWFAEHLSFLLVIAAIKIPQLCAVLRFAQTRGQVFF